ncbi:FxLYD domain-containing protein [Streptomyces sp. NPDC017260]|uniref:FxLYD domain-containing protein n=1 Tax=unclassified Streptomyces TaxID=2593676 RepID=UPI0037975E8F
MAGRRVLRAVGVMVLAGAVLAGCSDGDGSAADVPSEAGSAAASRAASAASSLASRGSDAVASATAEAGRWLEDIQEGADVKDDVELGAPKTDTDGRTTVRATVDNTADSTKSFAVQVNFTDAGGSLIDTAVVTVSDVPAGESARATARSTHDLSGDVRAVVARAVRY